MEAIRRRAAGVLACAYGIGSLLWSLLHPTVSDLGFALEFALEFALDVFQVLYFLVSGVALCFGISNRCRWTHEAVAALLDARGARAPGRALGVLPQAAVVAGGPAHHAPLPAGGGRGLQERCYGTARCRGVTVLELPLLSYDVHGGGRFCH